MARKRLNTDTMITVIEDDEIKAFSVHQCCMDDGITKDVAQLQGQGRKIHCSSTPESADKAISGGLSKGYRQVEDVRDIKK